MGECKKHWGLPGSHLDYCKWCEPECKHEGATFDRGTYEKGVLTRTATCACGETYTWSGGKHEGLPKWVIDSTMELEESKEDEQLDAVLHAEHRLPAKKP